MPRAVSSVREQDAAGARVVLPPRRVDARPGRVSGKHPGTNRAANRDGAIVPTWRSRSAHSPDWRGPDRLSSGPELRSRLPSPLHLRRFLLLWIPQYRYSITPPGFEAWALKVSPSPAG